MRVLVTGGSGYIGSRVLRDLSDHPDVEEIVDVDLRPPPAGIPKVTFVQRSVTEDLRDLFRSDHPFDVALHLAWILDPMHDAARQREICIGGTKNFLAGCEAGAVRQVLFMSSGTAYGAHPEHDKPLEESAPLRPKYHFQYSAEKREAETLVDDFARAHPHVIVQVVRPVVVAGPHISNFIIRSMEKAPMRPRRGAPVQLVHEDDCAAALVAIVRARRPGAFNVAADGTLSLEEAIRKLGTRTIAVPAPLLYAAAWVAWELRLTFIAEAPPDFVWFISYPWLLSNRRLKEELGFRFRYDCAATLDAYVAAQKQRRSAGGTPRPAA